MTVLRRLDAKLKPTNQAVLDMSESLDKAGVVDPSANSRPALLQYVRFTLGRRNDRLSR